jgi:NTE family protein
MGGETGKRVFPENTPELVHALSHIRTDLDSFSDLEAYTLMFYGYRLSGEKLKTWLTARDGVRPERVAHTWRFLDIEDVLADPQRREQLLVHLNVGSKQFFKVFFLKKAFPYVIICAPLLLPVGLSALILYLLPPIPSVAWVLLGLVALSILVYSKNASISRMIDRVPVLQRLRRRLNKTLAPLGVPALIGLVSSIVAWIQLRIFNRLFLHYGRLDGGARPPKERSADTRGDGHGGGGESNSKSL